MKSHGNLDTKPGPGQYELQNDGSSHFKGCTIGEKFNQKSNYETIPGPGSYQTSLKRPQSGTKIGRASRSGNNGDLGPGPGAYNQGYRTKDPSEVKFGTGKRNQFGNQSNPGPGAYEVLKNSMKGITISGHKGKQHYDMTPGPGAYQLGSDELQRPCSAK